MLYQGNKDNSMPSERHRPLGILDSPTLARVERAMLRHDEGINRHEQSVLRSQYTQSLLPNYGKDPSSQVIKRGLLYQQRDKLFSRWKERYFILTRDYLHCFRRATGHDRISEMGQFLFKIKLNDVAQVEWENKKTYSTIALVLGRDGKIYLRAAEGLEDWFELLEECISTSKERRKALRYSHEEGRSRNNNNTNNTVDQWMIQRQRIHMGRIPPVETMTPKEEPVRRRIRSPREEPWESSFNNRLSLLTDIDINACEDSSSVETPSITSYKMSDDIFCIQPPSLRGMGSFRSNVGSTSSTIRTYGKREEEPPKRIYAKREEDPPKQYFKFRERSYSDIQRV